MQVQQENMMRTEKKNIDTYMIKEKTVVTKMKVSQNHLLELKRELGNIEANKSLVSAEYEK